MRRSAKVKKMQPWPWFVTVVAIALGCFDLLRGVVHTMLAGSVGIPKSGVDVSGPTGRDQLMFMVAFGYSNLLTGAALIYLGLRDRFGALLFIGTIPITLMIAGIGLRIWGANLEGVGVFPGQQNMAVYAAICILTVIAALIGRWRTHRNNPFSQQQRHLHSVDHAQ